MIRFIKFVWLRVTISSERAAIFLDRLKYVSWSERIRIYSREQMTSVDVSLYKRASKWLN